MLSTIKPNKLLRTHALYKSYQTGKPVLRNLNTQIEKGKIIAILGESGSGKSTLLKCLGGQILPDSGGVFLNNKPVKHVGNLLVAGHPDIKMVNQNFDLSPSISIEKNIKRALLGFEDVYKEKRLAQLLSIMNLTYFSQRQPKELSGGQQQRVALAVALASEPEIILMDEPFSQVDFMLKEKLKEDIFHALKESNQTAVFVTHDPNDASACADEVWIIKDGKIIETGDSQTIFNRPRLKYTAQILGYRNILLINSELKKIMPSSLNKFNELLFKNESFQILKNGLYSAQIISKTRFQESYIIKIDFFGLKNIFIQTLASFLPEKNDYISFDINWDFVNGLET